LSEPVAGSFNDLTCSSYWVNPNLTHTYIAQPIHCLTHTYIAKGTLYEQENGYPE
jgi:hypothetical protein